MRKLIATAFAVAGLFLPTLVSAQGVQQQNRVQDPDAYISATVTPKGNQIENQNQFQIQNMGEEQMLTVATQQMQQLMDMEGLSETVGSRVRILAQEQVQAQTQIQNELNRMESKSSFMKKLFGPDFGAIKNLNAQVEQNRLRIQELQQLQYQVVNQADKTEIQNAVEVLLEQNTNLQEQIIAEEKIGSIFGWLVRLLNR